ncbi:MAG: DUF167 domain-containing protein [Sphingobium sp.]
MSASFLRVDGPDLILAVRLTPRGARDAAGGIWQDDKGAVWIQASVRAVPEKGKANAALVALIAKSLRIPAKSIALESGGTGRLKRLRLAGYAGEAERIEQELNER